MNIHQAIDKPQEHLWVRARASAAHLGIAFRVALIHLSQALRSYPWLVGFLVLYAVLRIGANLLAGARPQAALMSMLVVTLVDSLLVLVIDTLHYLREGQIRDVSLQGTRWERKSLWVPVVLLGVWAFWGVDIINNLQGQGLISGTPILNWLPGWRTLQQGIQALSAQLHGYVPLVDAVLWESRISNLVLRSLLPVLFLMASGYRWRDFGLNFRNWQILAPVILIATLAYISNGVTGKGVWFLGLTLLYPGLTEELFYWGLLQRSFSGWLRPGYAVLLAAILFGALHFPYYYFDLYQRYLPLALLNVADVILTGLVWGYAFRRMGSVLPLAVYHALSDLVGF